MPKTVTPMDELEEYGKELVLDESEMDKVEDELYLWLSETKFLYEKLEEVLVRRALREIAQDLRKRVRTRARRGAGPPKRQRPAGTSSSSKSSKNRKSSEAKKSGPSKSSPSKPKSNPHMNKMVAKVAKEVEWEMDAYMIRDTVLRNVTYEQWEKNLGTLDAEIAGKKEVRALHREIFSRLKPSDTTEDKWTPKEIHGLFVKHSVSP